MRQLLSDILFMLPLFCFHQNFSFIFFNYCSQCLILAGSNAMSDHVTLYLPTSDIQTRAFFNPSSPLASHRSRRTLSLPAREKPIIPPAILETPEVAGEQESEEQQQICLEANYNGYNDEIRKSTFLKTVSSSYLRKMTSLVVFSMV